jgi:triacylglycerol lipase
MFHPFRTPKARKRVVSLAVAGAAIAGSIAAGSPANANESAPARFKRDPVLFVHGFTRTSADFAPYIARYKTWGYSDSQLFTIDYNWAYPNVYAAYAIQAKVEQIKAATGAAKVDIVAHSMGAYGTRYYLKNLGGTASVDTFVSVSGPNHGTLAAYTPECAPIPACVEMQPTSAFFNDPVTGVNVGDETPGNVRYVTLRTEGDDLVFPSSSTELSGAINWVSPQTMTHMGYAVSDEAINLSLAATTLL